MSYPQPGWAPPPPVPHAYAGPGGRPWMPYGVPPPHAYAAYPHTARPPEPPKDEYWATELKPNPLGLENMHIRAEELRRENNNNNNSSSSSTARVPSSSSYSRASDFALRNSYPPNASTRTSLAPTKSHPNSRLPSPAPRPRQYERERDRDRDRDVVAPSARYATYPETTGINGTSNSAHPPTTYQRSPSRAYGGRTSVPVEAGDRYSSASASAAAAHAAQMAARSQTLPGASGRRHTTAAMASADVPQAQGMQRSKTMPGEMLAATSARDRAVAAAAAQAPRRSSDRYQYRQPQDDYEESEEDEDEDEDEDEEEDPVQAGWTHVTAGEGAEENRKKERKTTDRVRAWAENVKNMVSSHHGRDGEREREQEPDRETARMKEKSRSKSYHYAARADGDYDGYDDEGAYDAQFGSAALCDRERERERERGRITRHASAPDAAYAPISSQSHSASYTGPGGARITEEPEDMHSYSQTQQEPLSRSGSHRSHHSQTQYPSTQQSPYKARDRDWEYRERYQSGSSSGSESDEESEDEYEQQQVSGRINSTRGRERNASATPHPAPSRRLTERSDTLRVDGVDMATVTHGKAHLPSPRSLRQSSRTPSSRPSYEQVRAEREREYERAKTVNGHLAAGTSSASAAAVSGGYVYGTPPVTPTRQDHMHRTDSTRSPYASQPTSSASAAAKAHATEPASAVQTPARLAYLYRGTSASPSPASHRATSTQPQTQIYSHQHTQSQAYPQAQASQYGVSSYPPLAEPKPRKRSPHASRSPSPLPSGQGTSSSSAYYAALGRERTPSRAQSHSYSHSHGQSPSHAPRHGHSHSHTHHSHSHGHSSSQAVATHDGQRRSTSRAAGLVGSGYSSASGAAAASSAQAVSSGSARHVRSGFWNKRGDHLTDTGYVVYCPPGRCYPRELADYPDNAFRDHLGNVVYKTPDMLPELPESVPKSAGRAPEKGYDTFIRYVLVSGKS